MSGDYRQRNQLFLAKVEAVSGTAESPAPTTDAIRVRFPVGAGVELETLDTDYVQSSLDQSEPLVGGGGASFSPSCYLKGAGTAGTAPETGPLFRGAGFAQTLTAADVTGTAQAGAASSITLHAGASAVDDTYNGMVIETTGGTGSGQRRVISDYVGSTKIASIFPNWATNPDATTTFAIRANARYKPVSVANETLTMWRYMHRNVPAENSRRRRAHGCAGNLSINLSVRGFAELAFQFRGLLTAQDDDVAKPADPVYNAVDPAPFLSADAYLGGVSMSTANTLLAFNSISFDLGARVEQFDDPAAAFGFDIGEQIGRVPAGRIVRKKRLITAADPFDDWIDSRSQPLWLNWGPAIGRRVSIFMPAIRYVGLGDGDVRGFGADDLPFRATGADTGIYICIW